MFTVIGFEETKTKCQHCGKDIRNVVILHSDDGIIRVGIKCAEQLTDKNPSAADVKRIERRRNRALRQWAKNAPPAKTGEGKDEYVTRRVGEMANALAAGKAWLAHYTKWFEYRGAVGGNWVCKAEKVTIRAGVSMNQLRERHVARFERRYQANRFDMILPIWELKKL